MPESKSRTTKAKPSAAATARAKTAEVLKAASQLDRRRQAQIENQKGTITRLLETINSHECPPALNDPHSNWISGKGSGPMPGPVAVMRQELDVVTAGAATLKVENEDLRATLKELVLDVLSMNQDEVPMGNAAQGLTDEMFALSGVQRPEKGDAG